MQTSCEEVSRSSGMLGDGLVRGMQSTESDVEGSIRHLKLEHRENVSCGY